MVFLTADSAGRAIERCLLGSWLVSNKHACEARVVEYPTSFGGRLCVRTHCMQIGAQEDLPPVLPGTGAGKGVRAIRRKVGFGESSTSTATIDTIDARANGSATRRRWPRESTAPTCFSTSVLTRSYKISVLRQVCSLTPAPTTTLLAPCPTCPVTRIDAARVQPARSAQSSHTYMRRNKQHRLGSVTGKGARSSNPSSRSRLACAGKGWYRGPCDRAAHTKDQPGSRESRTKARGEACAWP